MRARQLLSTAILLSTFALAAAAAARTAPQVNDAAMLTAPQDSAAARLGAYGDANTCLPNAPEPAWDLRGRRHGCRCITPSANGG